MSSISCPSCNNNNIKFELFKVNKRKPYTLKAFFYALSSRWDGAFLLCFIPVIGWILLLIIFMMGYKVTEEEWMICQDCGHKEEV